jgi:hypothetical protein
MDPNRGDAERRYRTYRSGVHRELESVLQLRVPTASVTGINFHALRAWKQQWLPTHVKPRQGGQWNWEELRASYQNEPKRLEVAIWAGDQLCGLILGRMSTGRNFVSIEYVEGYDGEHPFGGKILGYADIAGIAFADQVSGRVEQEPGNWAARKVRIVNPAEGLVEKYRELGYEIVPGSVPTCMEKGVPQ